jgi:hypothetical protein
MVSSGEAESRAVAGAVRGAIGQARLDAGVNITGLLVDMGSADSVDFRQHLMCWQLTRVLRPSLAEKVQPSVVRSVVDQQVARSRTMFPSHWSWRGGSPASALSWMVTGPTWSVTLLGQETCVAPRKTLVSRSLCLTFLNKTC